MENKPKAIICLAVSSPVDLTQCKSIGGKAIVDNNKFKVVYKPSIKDTSK
ncbi:MULTISPECIES: hypothetical protein [Serratia]|nr:MULTISPECIES: hypothetical protein [Serratia]MCW6016228.1 hypothetical protein [Serratia marcescens]NVM51951.1 hypothetical protein [Serratia ureilytica]WLS17235.1 hypothetical protein RAA91_00290 [Serratia marcescens]HCB1447337.1 hypothetical protein [Serratia marcescens]HCB1484873.1 hypothetical protein [Serratia marcescens]